MPFPPTVQRLRHAFLVRLLALLVGMGTFGVAVRSVEASPAARYRAWLLGQVRAERAALVRAALDAMQGQTTTPSLFLGRYAEAQLALVPVVRTARAADPRPASEAPTGAWFGHPELSFLDALALLEGRLRTFDAPASSQRVVATLAAPVAAPSGSAPLLAVGPAIEGPVTAPVAVEACVSAADGAPRAVLHETSAAQPCGP